MWRTLRLLSSVLRVSTSKSAGFLTCSQLSTAKSEPINVLRARLLYQSKKRGILENDIIIGGFAAKYLTGMAHDELTAYDKIINGAHMEWDLYYYCVNRRPPPDSLAECSVFKKICEFARQGPVERK